ncbi:FecCD family ABC transporter permease [Mycolicibacterium tusciae]|uniref:FecCD family ABC transporter permease n=1 Tax=Mycolicibacterium tusciae TaxID=75922 RepID=UPI00024A2ED8|nr:iron ABC transporter permease [Mycolicibacterium tusciae]
MTTTVVARVPPNSRQRPRRREPSNRRQWVIIGAGAVLSVLTVVVCTTVGTANAGPADLVRSLGIWLLGQDYPDSYRSTVVILGDLRLPRALLAFAGGAALSVAGVVMQGLLRNPLVSPYTLGLSSASAFGAALAIVVGRNTIGHSSVALTIASALICGLIVSAVVLGLASARQLAATTLILLGVALSQLFEALTSSLQFFVDEDTLAEIVHWAFGSVNNAQWGHVALVSAVLAVSLPYLLLRASAINAIAFAGDDAATSFGINVPRTRAATIFVSVALTAVVVSFTGVIGFVGLVGPHIARILIGSDHRYLLPFGAISGGLLLLVADTVGRTVLSPAVIPVGIVVALVGAPIFINLIFSKRATRL